MYKTNNLKINSWCDLIKYKREVESNKIVLYRSLEKEKKYEDYKKRGGNVDFIKNLKSKLSKSDFIIEPNNFPYFDNKIARHYIFWFKNGDLSRSFILQELSKYFKEKVEENNVIIWENTLQNKSIPEINHYQILIQPKSDNFANLSNL